MFVRDRSLLVGPSRWRILLWYFLSAVRNPPGIDLLILLNRVFFLGALPAVVALFSFKFRGAATSNIAFEPPGGTRIRRAAGAFEECAPATRSAWRFAAAQHGR